MKLLLLWIVNAVALLILPYLSFGGVQITSFGTALVVAILLGLVNAVIRPVLVLLTLPVTILTLGLFILIINALLFWFVASFVDGFNVSGFWAAFFGAILYSILSWILSSVLLKK